MVPHGLVDTGEEPLRVVGFFSGPRSPRPSRSRSSRSEPRSSSRGRRCPLPGPAAARHGRASSWGGPPRLKPAVIEAPGDPRAARPLRGSGSAARPRSTIRGWSRGSGPRYVRRSALQPSAGGFCVVEGIREGLGDHCADVHPRSRCRTRSAGRRPQDLALDLRRCRHRRFPPSAAGNGRVGSRRRRS